MFSRAQRLTNKRIFERIFRRGTWVRGSFFSIRSIPSQNKPGQIAFVVSTKVSKSAQERNRIKRQLRSAFKPVFTPTSSLNNYYLLVVVHRKPTKVVFSDLVTEVTTLCNKIV